jgi:hydrogenase expression/formation protein HypD
LHVPGSHGDLLTLKGRGADVRVVYSPLDALRIARDNPQRRVVFFGIGFETTAPAKAMAVFQARRQGLGNFSMLVSHVLVPPAMAAILGSPDNRVQAFWAQGTCARSSAAAVRAAAARHRLPICPGFEPVDLLEGILMAVRQLEAGARRWRAVRRAVTRQSPARDLIAGCSR